MCGELSVLRYVFELLLYELHLAGSLFALIVTFRVNRTRRSHSGAHSGPYHQEVEQSNSAQLTEIVGGEVYKATAS